jgi:hypothetical protein
MMILSLIFIAFSVVNLFAPGPSTLNDLIGPSIAIGFAFGDLTFEDEPENMGGMTTVAYLGFSSEISVWPALDPTPSTASEAVKLIGSFTMKEAKKMHKVYVTPDTFSLDSENQGEIDGQSFRQKGEFFYPGTSVEAAAFCRKINNARGVLIGINPNTGDRLVIGSKDKPCYFKPSLSTGKAAADRRGVKVEFWADSFAPCTFYDGVIPLTEGDIAPIS